jgi:hypothetical protein
MRLGIRHYLLDAQDTLYAISNAAYDRMFRNPERHPVPRFAGQRVRSAEITVALSNGTPIAVERSSFNILTFKKNGALVSPLSDRHVRACAELALALDHTDRDTPVADASTRFLARGGQWTPTAAVTRQIEEIALGRQKCEHL